ncbi:MAG: MarR family winged helix-turn-helix transcriptional regulator [Kineosporiaceae bacterium]
MPHVQGSQRPSGAGTPGHAHRDAVPVGAADPHGDDDPAAQADAEAFAGAFGSVYLRFHRRDGKRAQLQGASRAVLQHLALAGPLTVGEAARHLDRAQSVVSDIVTHLEQQGLLERERDPADRRRTLVWLTAQGQEALRRDREVLSRDLLARAMARMAAERRAQLLSALTELLEADAASGHDH